LLEIGADHVVNSSVEDFSREVWRLTRKRGVDAAINFTGGDTWTPSIRALRPRGRLIVCGATAGFVARTDLRYVWEREIDVLGSNRFGIDDLTTVLDFVATGRLRPVISHVLPLSECREAEWLMERRAAFGKVILLP
jgi:alcohol dehydrogenase